MPGWTHDTQGDGDGHVLVVAGELAQAQAGQNGAGIGVLERVRVRCRAGCPFTWDSRRSTEYRLIQLSMMQEMTSFTLRYAFRSPEMPPSTAPAAMAANRHTYQGSPKPRAQ